MVSFQNLCAAKVDCRTSVRAVRLALDALEANSSSWDTSREDTAGGAGAAEAAGADGAAEEEEEEEEEDMTYDCDDPPKHQHESERKRIMSVNTRREIRSQRLKERAARAIALVLCHLEHSQFAFFSAPEWRKFTQKQVSCQGWAPPAFVVLPPVCAGDRCASFNA
jgi:hypothetical protein